MGTVAIHGFGRVGRWTLKVALKRGLFVPVSLSDIRDLSTMARFSGTMTSLVHRGILDEDQIADLVSIADGLVEMKVDENFRRFVRINHLRGVLVTPRWVPFEFAFEDKEEDESTVLGWNREQLK